MDLLHALARFQGPEQITAHARTVYKERQIATFPEREAELVAARHLISWASVILQTLSSLYDRATPVLGPSVLLAPAPVVQRAA